MVPGVRLSRGGRGRPKRQTWGEAFYAVWSDPLPLDLVAFVATVCVSAVFTAATAVLHTASAAGLQMSTVVSSVVGQACEAVVSVCIPAAATASDAVAADLVIALGERPSSEDGQNRGNLMGVSRDCKVCRFVGCPRARAASALRLARAPRHPHHPFAGYGLCQSRENIITAPVFFSGSRPKRWQKRSSNMTKEAY